MSQHPANLMFRFFLELVGLYSFGQWGWRQAEGPLRWLLVIGLPLLAAVIWATFKVQDDQEVSGKAIVPVSGRLRLGIELVFFGLAVALLLASGQVLLGLLVLLAIFIHYLLSLDRLRRLVTKP